MKKTIYLSLLLLSFKGFSQVNLTSNLKVCMPFNGNANDISGNSNNGTVNGATLTTDRFGNANKAYAFGTNMSISISSFSVLAPTDELTVSMWAKTWNNTSNCLFQLMPDAYNDRCTGCAAYSNSGSTMMLFDYANLYSGGRTTVTGIPIDMVNWHHYVYVVSQTGNLKQMYRDGSIVSNSTYAQTCLNKNRPFSIGGGFDQGNGSLWFNGYIDDVCIYNRALNSAEVSALYAGTGVCFNGGNAGIEELANIETAIVYPTVSETGIYNLSMKNVSKNSKLEIYSVEGKLIKSYNVSEMNSIIDISAAESGIYMVKIIMDNKTVTQKLIKN